MVETVEKLRVFLASPGDLGEERAFVRDFLQNVVPHDPHLKHLVFELVSWDDPHHGTTMPAHLTPQEAVRRFHGDPASCAIVIVILAARLGTHLDLGKFRRADGSPYLSGTEWEYENAWNASPRPEILVYRRKGALLIAADDPQHDEKLQQWKNVEAFFKRFANPDGSARGGYWPYDTPTAFAKKFEADIRSLIAERPARSLPVTALATPPPPTLPPPLAPPGLCLGRAADTDAIVRALLAPTPPVAVLVRGGPGIGKTTLTREVANHPDIIARFGPRRWFVPLDTANVAETFDTAVIQAVGRDPTARFDAALARLADAPSLLVLDNLETPWEAAGAAVEARLAALGVVPGTALLCSFRGQDAVGVHWTLRHAVNRLSDADAAALFGSIAPDIAPDDPCLTPLLAALGGVPLAITLVARRAAPHHHLAPLWQEWQSVGTALAAWAGAETPRLGSVERSIEFSLRSARLTDAGRRLFRLLGVLPAGMAFEDIGVLLGPASFAAQTELLAVGIAEEREGRLDLLPPVRDHALRRHAPEAEDAARWCRHYLDLVRTHGESIWFTDGAEALARVLPEWPNIEAALYAAPLLGLCGEAARAAHWGVRKLICTTGIGTARAITILAEACHASGDAESEARCYEATGAIALARSQHDTARAAYEWALPLYRRVNDVQGEANCIKRLGDIALQRSRHDAARAAYEQALPLYRQVGAVLGEANCIQRLGDIALERSEHDAARAAYEQALPLYRQVGDVLGEANCIQRLGDIALRRSEHDAACAAFEQALPLYRHVGDVLGEANCIQSLGDITLDRSQPDAARAAYEQALPLYRQVGSVQGEANCIWRLGDIALERSEHDAARAAYEQALPLYRQVGAVLGEANCIQRLGDIALERSEHDAARAAWEQALAIYARIPEPYSIGWSHHRLAGLAIGAERAAQVAAAREAWTSIDRPDLVALLDALG